MTIHIRDFDIVESFSELLIQLRSDLNELWVFLEVLNNHVTICVCLSHSFRLLKTDNSEYTAEEVIQDCDLNRVSRLAHEGQYIIRLICQCLSNFNIGSHLSAHFGSQELFDFDNLRTADGNLLKISSVQSGRIKEIALQQLELTIWAFDQINNVSVGLSCRNGDLIKYLVSHDCCS